MRMRTLLHSAASLLCVSLFSVAPAFAQGAKVHSEYEPVQQEDQDHPQERERWFMRGRALPGESAAALRYRAHKQKMQLRAARAAAAGQSGASPSSNTISSSGWSALGPAPLASDASGFGQQDYNWVSGRATAVTVDPADATGNTVYLGGAYGGVWKSTNAASGSFGNVSGVSWTPLIDNQATLAVGSIAIQPQLTNPDPGKSLLLVGTGETNSSGDSYYGLGILRSPDAGQTWTLIQTDSTGTRSFAGLGFGRIAFSIANPQLVVAAAASASEGIIEDLEDPDTVNRGLYYSTNAGTSWTYATPKDGGTVADPGSASAVVYNATAGKFFAALRYHGFYSSSDGVNWTRMAAQPGTGLTPIACPAHTSTNCPIYRGELAVVPGRNEMYAWYVDAFATDEGIYKTTDGGSTWIKVIETNITNCGDSFGCGTQQGTYNLELLAVPNGSATDLYAGAINIFKCTISSVSPTCNGTGTATFVNLTHVYGCSSIARVHPDQHSLSFLIVNGKSILYFANDGGIYRALDGYTGLTTGTCGGSNQFDSLNQTLGSMTQFVSFSQHPSDANTILGGTQDNGSPATGSSQTSSSWLNVNAGDGGYNLINPDDPTEWFTANTDVSIQRCTSGISCHTGSFFSVVSNATVGGDAGPFYTPYILDPQNSSDLVVGTCRIWRGSTTGTGYSALSVNFETGSGGTCTGGEVNQVRSLAAGGAKVSGASNVIYAGTDGLGPLQPPPVGSPVGGHVWATTNAAGGTSTWTNRTGTINPGTFPISAIAVDTSDVAGMTAYVAIMGFHTSHIWKTSNAGASWTDFTNNLPDAPVNALVLDPGANSATGVLYAGTDVGVFASSTGAANWIEVGPAPNSGQAGYLPNVAVTALRIFDTGTTKLLRASTYGRGVWQFPLITTPDFQFSLNSKTQTIFPSQLATFDGTLIAFNGYNSSVALSCAAGSTAPPSTCTPNPGSVTPTSSGAGFILSAAGSIGDYSFNIHGAGSDSNNVTHDAAVTLHVVDFDITAPSPANTTANRPNSSQPVTIQVTAGGSFSGSVSLSCGALPTGAACSFSPSATVNPTLNRPVTVTLVISTTTSTPTGSSTVIIMPDSSGSPSKTQNLGLSVTALPDFTVMVNPSSLALTAGQTGQLSGTVGFFNGYTDAVNLGCVSGTTAPPSTCNISPVSVPSNGSSASFTVNLESDAAADYSFNIKGSGTDSGATQHSFPVSLQVSPDFTFSSSSDSQTVNAGGTAAYTLSFAPVGASTFAQVVTYSCATTGLPALSSCSFTPAQISAGAAATSVTLSIHTTASIAGMLPARESGVRMLLALSLPLSGLVIIGGAGATNPRRRRRSLSAAFPLIMLLTILMSACGGGGGGGNGGGAQPGTPAGTYTVTVNAVSGSLAHSQQLTLIVK